MIDRSSAEAIAVSCAIIATVAFLAWPAKKKKEQPQQTPEQMTQRQQVRQMVIEQAAVAVKQINESIKIANESADLSTRLSRAEFAKRRSEELQQLGTQYPWIELTEEERRYIGLDQALSLDIRPVESVNATIPGCAMLDGRPYFEYVEEVKQLKREKRNEEAAALLLRIIDVVEAEAAELEFRFHPTPWYYTHLGIVYRKMKRHDLSDAAARRYERELKKYEAAAAARSGASEVQRLEP